MADELPTPEEILTIHRELEEAYDMKYTGTRVAAPKLELRQILKDASEQDEVYLRAAALLRKLVTEHLFEDGNKRTAWLTVREYLSRHDEEPADHSCDAERVLRRIRRFDVDEIAEWLETGTIDEDRLEP